MDRLAYTAMTAASRTLQAMQVRANNLANASTPGFRADLERAEAVAVEGYGYDSRHLARPAGTGVDLSPGPLMATGRPLDVVIKGSGLFVVEHAGGEAYTRNGAFHLDGDGRLLLGGRPVLGEGGPVVLPEHQRVEISADGLVSVQPPGEQELVEVARLRLVDAPAAALRKNEVGLLIMADGGNAPAAQAVRLASGFLESSNVSVVAELTATLSLSRLFETQVKLMKAASDQAQTGNRLIRGS